MATLKQRLHRKNSSGTYDTVHLETSAKLVLMSDGTDVETAINGKANSSHEHAAGDITSGLVPTGRGGTGLDMSDIPAYALIRNSGAAYDYLYYTATASGALYATAANGQPKFGTLPVAQGGTGVTTLAALKTALGISSSGLNVLSTTLSGSTTALTVTPKFILILPGSSATITVTSSKTSIFPSGTFSQTVGVGGPLLLTDGSTARFVTTTPSTYASTQWHYVEDYDSGYVSLCAICSLSGSTLTTSAEKTGSSNVSSTHLNYLSYSCSTKSLKLLIFY